ncbi:ABC transporter permease [Deinococcus sp. MIMF12]|uniref:ABC transporter permease n=1 Tax=Deinococcus rhizophilus TaxID=3049544 RepID=A0ABT7JIH6_9DEIO|nr:ABC transporter permease [Deinococcus rhizophilus]MDL2344741.1 ABC transporter permease [Deinococcus rhizophilus]
MLAGAVLPWVLLRPNRLAPGDSVGLPPALLAGAVLLALLPGFSAWRTPRLTWLAAALTLWAGVWLLGNQTGAALAGQLPFARASAASGAWLYLLGAGVTSYGAARLAPRAGLAWLGLAGAAALLLSGHLNSWSVLVEGRAEGERWGAALAQHLRLVGGALGLALLIGAPLAVWISGRDRAAATVLGLASGIQTLPSLALLGLLIAPLSALANAVPALREVGVGGIGVAPALTAMTLYALLPVLRNGVASLRGVSASAVDAARGMGMTPAQLFWRVQLPLALPVWLSGVRQAAVLLTGVAAVAALIGAGGLGTYILGGLQSAASDLILLGAVPAALLALALDGGLRRAEGWLARRLGGPA